MDNAIAFIGRKLGMSLIYENGVAIPVTLVQILPNRLVETKRYDNFSKVVIAGNKYIKEKKVNKPQLKQFENRGIEPRSITKEFRINGGIFLDNGAEFIIGDYLLGSSIDVRGVSKGKGFQGGIKRWGFSGMNASHGVSLTHRSIGSTGNRSLPGRVFKGKKMPGQMGNKNSCIQNLVIKYVDIEDNVIAVNGSIPGCKNSTVFITNAIKSINIDGYKKINNITC